LKTPSKFVLTPEFTDPAAGDRLAELMRPPLVIRRRDEHRLHEIAIGAMLSAPRLAGGLLDELNRASVRADGDVRAGVIGLGSTVVCFESDGARSRYHRLQIVAPEDSDPALGRVSVLTDLGAALIGLSCGQSILWPDRVGGARRLFVLEVETPEPDAPADRIHPRGD
jgi:regulator of nucleoside diphosphate kinase